MSTAKAKRDAAIVAMYEDGATTQEVADRF